MSTWWSPLLWFTRSSSIGLCPVSMWSAHNPPTSVCPRWNVPLSPCPSWSRMTTSKRWCGEIITTIVNESVGQLGAAEAYYGFLKVNMSNYLYIQQSWSNTAVHLESCFWSPVTSRGVRAQRKDEKQRPELNPKVNTLLLHTENVVLHSE